MKTKFLIQGPRDKEKLVSLFPFFIKLDELFPEAEVNVIVDKGLEDILELLPHKVRVYPLPETLNSVIGIHKFAVNVRDVFNIDHFFDFSFDFKGALTGFCFRAKNRVGEDSGGKRLLYTTKVESSGTSTPIDLVSIKYLNTILESDVEDFFYQLPETEDQEESNVHQLFEEVKPHFFLIKNTDKGFDLWKELILLMDSGTAVVWDMKNLSLWQELKSHRDLKVELIIQGEVEGLSFLPELINKSEYILTDDKYFAHACLFYEKRAFLFCEDNYTRINSNYFSNVDDLIITEDCDVIEIFKSGKKKSVRVMDEILDLIHDVMKL